MEKDGDKSPPSSSGPPPQEAPAPAPVGGGDKAKKFYIDIAPTTGGTFELLVSPEDSILKIKSLVAKKLKVSKEQICLLHRESLLENCKQIRDYQIGEGSRLALVPSIETGLVTQRPEQSVLEALEGLNESQVGDFLSGKSPLNLTMRLGDHVMLIQLQLSKGKGEAVAAALNSESSASSSSHAPSTSTSSSSSIPSTSNSTPSTSSSSSSSSLIEASRNLTNTLKKLSSHVSNEKKNKKPLPLKKKRPVEPPSSSGQQQSTSSTSSSSSSSSSKLPTNHMQHHGKGVYSGTFSGTLNPSLQDLQGKPKKCVSTILYILNDLLGGVQSPAQQPQSISIVKKNKRRNVNNSSAEELEAKKVKKTTEVIITEEEKERIKNEENETLRRKLEELKEKLKIRKEKLLNNVSMENVS